MTISRRDTQTALASPSFLALACVGFIASAPAHAQQAQPDEEKKLTGVTVTDTAIEDEGYKVERVESPKAVAPLLDTPRSVVVIDKQVIKDTGSATLVDALRTVPGITFGAAEGGNPVGDRPFIRGFDSQGSTFVDGVRDISAQSREVFAIEQVQVVRGSDSTLGGRGSAGGSINIITKLPQKEAFIAGGLSYGTDDYKRITADVNQPISENIGVRVAAMWHDQDVAGRDAIWQKRWGVAPSMTVGLNSPTKLTLSYYHLDTDELPDSGIPYFYTIGNAPGTGNILSEPLIGTGTTIGGTTGTVKRSTFYGLKDRDFRNSKVDQVTMRFDHDFGNGIKFRNTARYSHNYQGYIFTQPDDQQGNVYGTNAAAPATAGGLVWRRANTRYGYANTIGDQIDLFGTFETGSIKHSFAVGAEYSEEKARRGTYVLATGSTISPRCSTAMLARFNCTSLFTPNPSDPWVNYTSDTATTTTPITKVAPTAEIQNDAQTISAYAFDSVTLTEQLILNVGARYDRFRSTNTPALVAGATSLVQISREDELFNYQAGLVFKPTSNSSLYASYATSATPPNALLGEGQEGNAFSATAAIQNALKVEKTKSMEAGAKIELLNGGLSLSGAVFQTETKNARVTIDGNGTIGFIGERRIRGAEIGWTGNITDGWSVTGGYSYLDAKIVDGGVTALTAPAITTGSGATLVTIQAAKTIAVPSVNTGRQFPQTAKHSFTLWSNYQITPAFSIGGGAFYTSRVYGGYSDNRAATQTAAGVVTVTPATKVLLRSIPSYWRFDARAGWKINEQLDLAVNVQNLTNKTYFNQAYTAHYASIAPGRSAFATLNFKY